MDETIEPKLNAWRVRRRELAPFVGKALSASGQPPAKELEFLHAHEMVRALEAAWDYERSLG